MELPREIIIGKNVITKVGDFCQTYGFQDRAIVVTDSITYQIAGKTIVTSLNEKGFTKVEGVQITAADIDNVKSVKKKIQEISPSILIGVGGGKPIDVTKLACLDKAQKNLPYVSIPTIPSHDGIASPRASIRGLETSHSVMVQSPIAVIADIEIIKESPYRYLASGSADVIANIIATADWELAHKLKGEYYGEFANTLSKMCTQFIMRNARVITKGIEESYRIVLEALISSGIAISIAGTSRPASGSEHAFSHALDIVAGHPALHGEQVGIGTIMMAYLHGMDWEKIRDTLKTLRAPITAKQLGVSQDAIIKALMKSHKIRGTSRYTILGEDGLTEDAAKKLAKVCEIID
ncbi:MAG: NAD(P)-dependent glycerol-1-phosphate dehydrogenase [Candidatus Helarchaeota archaeon]|nr:NAD(P)-dependent glycerol-1-phosphate dehydrogenase [Candidatus Helarchaeota archaeon]